MDFLEEEEKKFDEMNPEELKKIVPWHERFLLRFFPWIFFKWHAKKIGLEEGVVDGAEALFRDRCVDIFPFGGESRGFQIVIDNRFALYFYQDGDHFHYDGFEMGEYEDGDVTVFDELSKKE